MAQSPEYPDLPWVEAGSYLSGRPYGPPLWIVIHTTEGTEGLASAEAGAAYDAVRPDGTSTHYMHDQDSTVQEVRTTDRANAARMTGNRRGIHHELCGRAAQTPAQWDDAASAGTLRQAARQAARDARKWDIPVRHLTVAQVRAFERGFCAHKDISDAFGESDHQDPGTNYPWSDFLDMVRAEMGDDMDAAQTTTWARSAAGRDAIADAVWGAKPWGSDYNTAVALQTAYQMIGGVVKTIAALDQVDEQALAAALAPALAAAVTAQLPQGGLTQAQVEDAVRNVLRTGTGQAG